MAGAIAGTVFVCGILWQSPGLTGGGAVAACLALRHVGVGDSIGNSGCPKKRGSRRDFSPSEASSKNPVPANVGLAPASGVGTAHSEPGTADATDAPVPRTTETLVAELLATGRYALLLRPETKQHLTPAQVMQSVERLDEAMALVPAGRVLLGQLAEQSLSACGPIESDPKLVCRNLVKVEPVYLDRYCVTNHAFQQFVDSGGYEQMEYWDEEALPALLDFIDLTGQPGPRFWTDGRHEPGEERMPVVGVSWYEAWAYARWVGKRLPSDAEWTKAGAWPVESAPGRIAQRRYPWGESFDVRRANLYGSGMGKPVAVEDFSGGTSVGGVHQLIGNVWEWTDTRLADLCDSTLHVAESVISIRGGAYDTYFENQATCHFQSGDQTLSRRPNIGFRLALPMSDLESAPEVQPQDSLANDLMQHLEFVECD